MIHSLNLIAGEEQKRYADIAKQITCLEKRRRFMKKKKIAACFLSVLLAVSAIGCGSQNNQSSGDDTLKETDNTASETQTTEKPAEEPYTVKVMMFGDASTEDTNLVAEEITKIAKEEINVNVEILRVGFGSYGEQLNLALSSNEKIDVFCTLGQSTTDLADKGQIVPMNPYLDQEGKDIKAGIPEEDFKCASVGEDIYGFPTVKEKATNYGYIMLKSIADELGVSEDDITNLDDLETVMIKAKELYPDRYPIGMDFTNVYMPTTNDNLDGGIGVLEDCLTDSTEVVNWFQTDTYVDFVNRMYQWAQMGLVQPDASNNSESRLSLMQAGKVMGGFMGFNPGNVEGFASQLGQELISFKLCEPFSITGHVSGVVWCIANNSDNPAKAMEFLNLAYTNPEVSNLLVNGIEGRHYEIVDEENGIIDYPEGVDAATVAYSRLPWAWPNAALTYNWVGEREDQWDYLNEYNDKAHQSVAKGFKFDPLPVINEITACSNVTAKFDVALQCGVLNPEETLDKFYKELDDAGIQTIIDEKQKQLDEWLANK